MPSPTSKPRCGSSKRLHRVAPVMRVGIATGIGLLAGMLAKFVLAFMMIGIFVVALLL